MGYVLNNELQMIIMQLLCNDCMLKMKKVMQLLQTKFITTAQWAFPNILYYDNLYNN